MNPIEKLINKKKFIPLNQFINIALYHKKFGYYKSSILFRGVDWYFIPTTLISQGDSCIGGKTSINLKNVKNQLGTNYPPLKICIDTNFLKTLPQEQIKSGLGEMLHYFIFSSENDFIFFKQNFEENNFKNLIQRSLEIKKSVIEIDEKEKGLRILFNYGHTFGHALESLDKSNDVIRHGEAVGIGLLSEIYYYDGKNKNFLLTKKILRQYNLPTNIKNFFNKKYNNVIQNKIYRNIFFDKKKINQYPRYIKLFDCEIIVSELRDFGKIIKTIKEVMIELVDHERSLLMGQLG